MTLAFRQFFCSITSRRTTPLRRLPWVLSVLVSFRSVSSMTNRAGITQRNGDGTIIVSPQNEAEQSALIVISHGLGDTAEGFADVAEVSCGAY